MISFLDLKAPYLELKHELDEAIARVVSSGCFIGGPEVEQFEADCVASTERHHTRQSSLPSTSPILPAHSISQAVQDLLRSGQQRPNTLREGRHASDPA